MKLVDLNTLNDGPAFKVDPSHALATVRVTAITPGAWANAALALTGRVGMGAFMALPSGAVAIASTSDGLNLGPFNVAGLSEIRVEPTAIETAGGSLTPVYAEVEVTLLRAAINVTP